jgi:hypothetical protein
MAYSFGQYVKQTAKHRTTHKSDVSKNSVFEINAIDRLGVNDVHRTRYRQR